MVFPLRIIITGAFITALYSAGLYIILSLYADGASAQGKTFAVIAKSVVDKNFIEVWKGCNEAAEKDADQCELLGSSADSNPREQSKVIRNALNSNRFSALGISVTRSNEVARAIANRHIPVITFDSPLAAHHDGLTEAYVGPSNIEIGEALGILLQQQQPNGGTLCIMSSAHDTNLVQRVTGLRRQLSGIHDLPEDQRLNGEAGWQEAIRCPWDCADNQQRALKQLKVTIASPDITAFVSVGAWPLTDPDLYRQQLEPLKSTIGQRSILITTGLIEEEYQRLLQESLLHGLVSIDFHTMGQQLYQTMRSATEQNYQLHDIVTPVQTLSTRRFR